MSRATERKRTVIMSISVRNREYSIEEMVTCARLLREKLHADPYRPRFHPIVPEGFSNDANGAIWWKGRYHLFILGRTPLPGLEDPTTDRWDGRVWFHVSSADLVHWIHHPPALRADGNNPDPEYVGPQSGDAIENAPVPTLIYHNGTNVGTSIVIAEDDELVRWKPLPQNPVIPVGVNDETYVHDPCAWYDEGVYYALIGGRNYRPGQEGDCTSLFRSTDLVNWEYRGPFYTSRREWTEEVTDCACPDFFPLGQRHMLLMHAHWPYGHVHYYLGRFQDEQFHPEEHGRMNWPGGSFVGPETMLDGQGRRILFGWIPEGHYPPGGRGWTRFGWSSCISLPRVLSLGPDGTLRIQPVPELQALRLNHRRLENLSLSDGQETGLPGIAGDSLELDVRIAPGNAHQAGMMVRCSPDGAEQTRIICDVAAEVLAIQSVVLSEQGEPVRNRQEAPFLLDGDEPLRLHVFLDRSVLEVFANDRLCLTQRIYPSRSDSTLVQGLVQGNDARIESLDAWDMMPVV